MSLSRGSKLHRLLQCVIPRPFGIDHGNFEMGRRTKRFYTSEATNQEDQLIVDVQDGIRTLTFNRPEKKNAMNIQMALTIAQALTEANTDTNTSLVVVRGKGEYFTSGMDLSGFRPNNPQESSPPEPKPEIKPKTENPMRAGVRMFMESFIKCEKPLIGIINGPAVGFGVTSLGLFDAVYASDKATFKTRFGEFGLPPEFCSTYTFPRIMGYGKAINLLMFDTKFTAQEAFDAGLVSKIFPNGTDEEVFENIRKNLKGLSPKSLYFSKQLVRGRERQLLLDVCKMEQEAFDPEVAREVKKKFAMRKQQQ